MRAVAVSLSAFVVLAVLSGVWLGEASTGFGPDLMTLVIGAGVAVLPLLIHPPARWLRPVAAVFAFVVFWTAWIMGRGEASAAYNNAVRHGEDVRRMLADHRERTGSYPPRLGELDGELPGNRLLRGTVWRYERTADGYGLQVSDWLVTHRATHDAAFRATK